MGFPGRWTLMVCSRFSGRGTPLCGATWANVGFLSMCPAAHTLGPAAPLIPHTPLDLFVSEDSHHEPWLVSVTRETFFYRTQPPGTECLAPQSFLPQGHIQRPVSVAPYKTFSHWLSTALCPWPVMKTSYFLSSPPDFLQRVTSGSDVRDRTLVFD